MVQWFGLSAFTAEGPGSTPGQAIMILQAAWHGQQQKPTMRYHLTLITMDTIRKREKATIVDKDVEKLEPLCTVGDMQNGAAAMENSMVVPQKFKIDVLHNPAILLLGVYPKEPKAHNMVNQLILQLKS